MAVNSILIAGGNGNLGHSVADQKPVPDRKMIFGDIRDVEKLRSVFKYEKPDAIVHLAGLFSGSSETNPTTAWEVNATASVHLMKISEENGVGPFVFSSTIASYGSSFPQNLPENTKQWPENIYGATKVAVERIRHWIKFKYGFDFRCLRLPLVISPFVPIGAVTAYPGHACLAAKAGKQFTFPVRADTGVSTLYLMDVICSIFEFTLCDQIKIKQPAYHLHGFHFNAGMLAAELKNRFPNAKFNFDPQEAVDSLIRNWPDNIQDLHARNDWGWVNQYDFKDTLDALLRAGN